MTAANDLLSIETIDALPDSDQPNTPSGEFWTNEPYYDRAWHLSHFSGIHVDEAWEHYSGKGVIISLLDGGFDHTDPELAPNYRHDLSYDHEYGDHEIYPGDGTSEYGLHHGTMTTLIAAGARNGQGSMGVAFDAEWSGQRVEFGGSDGLESAFRAGALNSDVFNNSWGFTNPYSGDYGSSFYRTQYEDVIDQATGEGRDGLGTIIVFSAGNAFDPDGSTLPTHSMRSEEGTIAVGNYMQGGGIAPSSSQGAAVHVSAPGTNVVIQHDGTIKAGGGTSAAAPVVSGVSALMLEANPELGWRDVQDILALSSRYLNKEHESWEINGADNWNGGGMTHSNSYGFGGVDAGSATALARNWLDVGTTETQVSVKSDRGERTSTDNGPAVSFHVGEDIDIQHVRISIDWDFRAAGLDHENTAFRLVSPEGTKSVFLSGQENSGSFEYYSNAFWEETSAGTWYLEAVNMETGDTSLVPVDSARLKFMGDEIDANDQYFYTKDFLKILNDDPSRGTLSDAAGTDDIINAAASPHNNIIRFVDGQNSLIAGGLLRIEDGIEHIIAGQGDDHLIGDEAANTIFADFGADTVRGGAGDDYIVGGGDGDVLRGEGGADRIVAQDGADEVSGGNGADTVLGGDGSDTIDGGSGDDLLHGWVGADRIRGQDGDDRVFGNQGDDMLFGNSGNDSIWGRIGHDEIAGGTGDDMLSGGDGHDTLRGGTGDDRLDGGTWADVMDGGQGDDVFIVDNEADRVIEAENSGDDAAFFTAVGDYSVAPNVETGRLLETAGSSSLTGNAGENSIWGNDHDNVLGGGAGQDTLAGGDGEDVFVFETAGSGPDFVTDFEAGADVLDLSALVSDAAGDVWRSGDLSLQQSGENVVVSLTARALDGVADGATDVVFLAGVQVGDLSQDDFVL